MSQSKGQYEFVMPLLWRKHSILSMSYPTTNANMCGGRMSM